MQTFNNSRQLVQEKMPEKNCTVDGNKMRLGIIDDVLPETSENDVINAPSTEIANIQLLQGAKPFELESSKDTHHRRKV